MKPILIFLLSLCFAPAVFASHVAGGELRYEFDGTNYILKLALFKACNVGSSAAPSTAVVNIKSVSASYNSNVTLVMVSTDTISTGCPSSNNTCTSTTSPYPGYVVINYQLAITLPATASDWVFSYDIGARGAMNNIVSSNMHIEATLDNTAAINSNAWTPNTPQYIITNTTTVVPLETIDAEGDSLAYDLVPPMQAAGLNVSYQPGYGLTTPFGMGVNICSINAATQELTLRSPSSGQFALAYKVKEYRNGVLVGTHIRDFMVGSYPGSTAYTYPAATSLAAFNVYTCPGQVNSVTVNFTDPTITDSVYVTVTTPTIPGWTFTSTVANGIPTGSATINWTTPGTLNPATLPFFYINLRVRDNVCPRSIADYAIIVRTRQCLADSVWPGDANGDKTVNIYDPLAIAIAMGQTGAARTSPTTTWVAQACTPWTNAFVTNNTNMKHADCDGNGTVTSADLTAVTTNYGMTHPKEGGDEKQTAGPSLYFDMTGVVLTPGTLVSVPIKLGDANNMMSGFYGLATRISVNGAGTVTVPATISTATTWLGTSVNTINFSKMIAANSIVDWAHARTDHQNTSGQGVIGTLNFTVPANAVPGSNVTFKFTNTKMIDRDGNDISTFSTVDGAATIPMPQIIPALPDGVQSLSVLPNPSHASAVLQISLAKDAAVNLKVVDMLGKTVWQQSATYTVGGHNVELPTQRLANGMYMIHAESNTWNHNTIVKWVKQ